jgi:Flp pilus assembly protein TadG
MIDLAVPRRTPRLGARALWRDPSGGTAVQFAIVAVAMLSLVFGIIEFGRLLWTREALQETATAGARCMAVLSSSCASGGAVSASLTTSYIQSLASGDAISLPSGAITLNSSATCAGVSGFSQVVINYTFNTILPVFLPQLGAGLTVSTTACFPNQPQ